MQNQGRICPRGASYYLWREGDTLSSVAQTNGITVQSIRILNEGVDFAKIAAGTEICLPSQVYTCVTGQPYAVQRGETFASIAERLGVTTLELQERNPGVDSDNLSIGQVICIPRQTTSTPVQPDNGNSGNGSNNSDPGQIPVIPRPPIVTEPGQQTPAAPGISCPTGYAAKTIQRGQTYADLLVDLNVSYRAMRTANPLIRPGAMIAGTPYCAPPSGTRQICNGTRTYTIQPGENLASIAANLNTTRGRLLMLNPTLVPTDFSSGTVICVPLT